MRIAVTGANGFVGSHLCAHLVERGHEVTAIVRRAGAAPAGTTELVVTDIGPDTVWGDALDGHEAVIHLAARVHVMTDDAVDPLLEFRRVNAWGTETLGRAAAESGVSRFVFLSSVKVNGEETVGAPFTASSPPLPLDPYGVSKLEGERLLTDLSEGSRMSVAIVRTPLIFGPGVGGNFLRFLGLASRRLPLPLGSVRNRRSFASVWTIATVLEASAFGAADTVVMAGESESLSTPDLLRRMGRALGSSPVLFPFPVALLRLAGRATGQSTVVHRLVSSLEVEPGSTDGAGAPVGDVGLDEALRRTAQWYRSES